MAEDGFDVVTIQDNYYRDCFGKVVFILCGLLGCIGSLVAISTYIYITEPPPVTFKVGDEWRIVKPVSIQEPYLSKGDLVQWVSNVVPHLFDVNFMYMDEQLLQLKKYFTNNGYEVFMNQFKNNIPKNEVAKKKLFVEATLLGAPFILSDSSLTGLIAGRYAWDIQVPIKISYSGLSNENDLLLTLKLTVVRTETIDNLTGVLIHDVIVETGNTGKTVTNG